MALLLRIIINSRRHWIWTWADNPLSKATGIFRLLRPRLLCTAAIRSASSSLRKGVRFNVSKQLWVSIYCQCGMCSTVCVKRRVERKRGMTGRAFSMLRGLLLIRYCACVLVWVLLSKYSIYCITLFSDSTNCNTKKPNPLLLPDEF